MWRIISYVFFLLWWSLWVWPATKSTMAATFPSSVQQRRDKNKESSAQTAKLASNTDATTTTATTATTATATSDSISEESFSSSSNSSVCRLWMAPSSTGTDKEPKFGLYAGIEYHKKDTIPNSELVIPLIDFEWEYNRDTPIKDKIVDFVESLLWTSEHAGTKWEGNYSAPVAIPGIGMLANYHSGVANVDYLQAAILLRHATSNFPPPAGEFHVSRGAITPYYNATLKATQHIPVGMELFANFGDEWDGNRTNDLYQDKITRFDYEEADRVVDTLLTFFQQQFPETNTTTTTSDHDMLRRNELQQDILDFMLEHVLERAAGKHAKTIRSLIPATPKKLQHVKDRGGTFLYRYPDLIKTPAWLERHGMCLDNIRQGPSTIPDAGRGAFATRNIRHGEVIVPTPMLHIPDQDLMNMYKIIERTKGDKTSKRLLKEYDRSKPIGQQLFINYCFGHPESSLLLFPMGPLVTLMNHYRPIDLDGSSSPRMTTSYEPNAYLAWSKDKSLRNQHELHDFTVSKLADVNRIGLVMKVVALRNIAQGEEILLDYGSHWEQAYSEYKQQWKLSTSLQRHHHNRQAPLTAQDLRERYRNQPLETRSSIQEITKYQPHPYGNIGTACYLRTVEPADGQPMVYDAPHIQYPISIFAMPIGDEEFAGDQLVISDILDRTHVPPNAKEDADDENVAWFYNYTVLARVGLDKFAVVKNVPHRACTFVDKPYTSDIHNHNAFRHKIGILDHHFPQAWRDLR